MSTDIILFRFHKNIEQCKLNLSLLKHLNPSTPIYGIGEPINGVDELYDSGLDELYVIDDKSSRWKWLNGDLVVADWFRNIGNTISFNKAYLVEWDMLFTKPLGEVYPHINAKSIGLTGAIPLTDAKKYEWDWVTGKTSDLVSYLKQYAEKTCGPVETPHACIFPGTCFTKSFLDDYSSVHDIPEVGNDELRIGILSNALGYDVIDNEFYEWKNDHVYRPFNCTNSPVDKQTITGANQSVFHPVRDSSIYKELLRNI